MTTLKKYTYILISTGFFAIGCSSSLTPISETKATYVDTKKADKKVNISYSIPVITPTTTTKQQQTKGGVTISAEIVPFVATREVKSKPNVTYYDVTKPGYDNF